MFTQSVQLQKAKAFGLSVGYCVYTWPSWGRCEPHSAALWGRADDGPSQRLVHLHCMLFSSVEVLKSGDECLHRWASYRKGQFVDWVWAVVFAHGHPGAGGSHTWLPSWVGLSLS